MIIESINSGKSLPQAIDTAINEFTSLLVGGSQEFEARIADLKEIGVRLTDAATGTGTLRRVAIDPLTRVEGHGKVTLMLDEDGIVRQARLHIVEFRGFEKFCEGRT